MKESNKESLVPFKVYVRIRPLLEREIKQINSLNQDDQEKKIERSTVSVENNTIYLKDPFNAEYYGKNMKAFSFDHVFTEKDQNKTIFNTIIKKLIDNIFQGYNSTALAYGITGTGKTHTMFGDIYKNLNFEKGICMYSVDYLFDKINSEKKIEFYTKMSYLEIYNEQVIDLLTDKPSVEGIMLIEDPKKGVIVPELTQKIVSTSDQVLNNIIIGNQRRTMGATGQNQFSSRSHAILEITIEQRTINSDSNKEEMISSKMSFVDLAGSERGGLEKGIRREEGSNINKSLLALGNCINILSDKTKKGFFVPYRDSKLTRLLKDSLGGNIVTLMIVCVSPSPMSYEETNSTLNYASRANKIEKKITKNIKEIDQYSAQYREMIVSLRAEIVQLKDIIRNQHLILQLKPSDSLSSNNENANQAKHYDKTVLYDDFFNEEEIEKLEYDKVVYEIMNTHQSLDDKSQPVSLTCNYDVYENFLKTNLNNLTEEEFEDFESKMEALYFDKINLEDRIKTKVKDSEVNEKYSVIRTLYEQFIELINDKLIENIEQNMILRFNYKEIQELNEVNCKNLKSAEEQIQAATSIDMKLKLNEDVVNYQKSIADNDKEKIAIQTSLDQNIHIKALLKKLLFKFISNTQMKEIKELQENYTSMLNEKTELETKNKTYQEFLSAVMKEKEEKMNKIAETAKELSQAKQILLDREKRVRELQKRLNCYVENTRILNKGRINALSLEPMKKTSVKKLVNYFDDCDIKTAFPSRLKKERRATSRSGKRVNHKAVVNNFISINLNQNIPTVTAYIEEGNIYTREYQSNREINDLKTNLLQSNSSSNNKTKTKTKVKTIPQEYEVNNEKSSGIKLHKTNSINNLSAVLNNSSSLIKEEIGEGLKGNNSLLNLASNLKGNNPPLLNHSTSKKIQVNQLQKKLNQKGSSKSNNCPNNNPTDSVPLLAVNDNNKEIIYTSPFDLMNNNTSN